MTTAPRASGWFRARLRADRLVAAVLVVLTAPLVAVLALLVRRHDGGPAFITVDRVGRGGRTFGMWKIRSMRVAGDDGRAGGASLTASDDDRITPVGRRLRALHLDELPQLVNVVRGDMCLLGPRPEAPPFVDRDDPGWQQVLVAPPGIAGPTQLVVGDWELSCIDADQDGSAYRDVVLPVKLAIDAWYVQRSSLRVDLRVVVALLRRVLASSEDPALLAMVRAGVPRAAAVVDAPAG